MLYSFWILAFGIIFLFIFFASPKKTNQKKGDFYKGIFYGLSNERIKTF